MAGKRPTRRKSKVTSNPTTGQGKSSRGLLAPVAASLDDEEGDLPCRDDEALDDMDSEMLYCSRVSDESVLPSFDFLHTVPSEDLWRRMTMHLRDVESSL